MAVPILPIIQTLVQIAEVAGPAFTRKPAEVAKSDPVIAKQIEELQAATTQNAQSIQVLAEELAQALRGMEAAAQDTKKRLASYKAMLFFALGLSVLSMVVSITMLFR